jgi:hypothetical protein
MFNKISKSDRQRKKLLRAAYKTPFQEHLIMSQSIDLMNNPRMIDLGNRSSDPRKNDYTR